MYAARHSSRNAFSLIELSIVIVLLGLLIGGILLGKSLIRGSELKSVISELNRFDAATKVFREKFYAIPGDMPNATGFWGKDNANCAADSGTASDTGTCNGNGDGTLNMASAASATGEMFQLWRQLALAGMISGSFTGLAGPDSIWDAVFNENTPSSKLQNAGWFYLNFTDQSGSAHFNGNVRWTEYDYGNALMFSTSAASITNTGSVLTPEEAWNIDKKTDDGMPNQGNLIAYPWTTCTTATTKTSYAAEYTVNDPQISCALVFVNRL